MIVKCTSDRTREGYLLTADQCGEHSPINSEDDDNMSVFGVLTGYLTSLEYIMFSSLFMTSANQCLYKSMRGFSEDQDQDCTVILVINCSSHLGSLLPSDTASHNSTSFYGGKETPPCRRIQQSHQCPAGNMAQQLLFMIFKEFEIGITVAHIFESPRPPSPLGNCTEISTTL
jgi:hypothetical protein